MSDQFQIDSDNRLHAIDNGTHQTEGGDVFGSLEDFERLAAGWPLRRLIEIWNQLPKVQPVSRFENRQVAVRRIWRMLSAPAGSAPPRRGRSEARAHRSKSEMVLNMLRNPEGATLKALMKATRWQAHSVRGFLSRKVSKNLGLHVESFRRDGERVYAVR